MSGESVSYWDGAGGAGSLGGNNLNQTRSRGTLRTRVSGTSDKNATVTVGGGAATREATPGRYWDYAWPNHAQSTSATVNATLSGAPPQTGTAPVLVRPATETLAYDADGNLIEDSLWIYQWDAENRLARMATSPAALGWGAPNRELLFTYDYLGRRVRKESRLNGSAISDRKYLYHGWSLMAELDSATGKLVRSYTWGLDVASSLGGTGGVGGLVLETVHSDTTLTAFHVSCDGGGNVTALVNRGTNQLAASYEYGPFGENVRTQVFDATLAAQGQPFRFSTKFTDPETGLVYYGRRYYDPGLGRFLNRDPLGEAGGHNLYAFVGNSPVNGYDYLGGTGFLSWLREKLGLAGSEGSPNGGYTFNPPMLDPNAPEFTYDPPASGLHSDRATATPTTGSRAALGTIHRQNEAITGAPNSAVMTSTVTGRVVRSGGSIADAGFPGDSEFAHQVQGAVVIAGGLTPWVGDVIGTATDIYDVGAPDSSTSTRVIAGASIGINVLSGGIAPNAGPIRRGVKKILGEAGEALSREARDVLRERARAIWEATTGRRAIWDDLQVHHRIPLEWAHLFPKADANRLSNLVGVASAEHSQVTELWNAWRRSLNGRTPTQAEVMQQALRIDELFTGSWVFLK
ncbi:MAG: hypothetical protein FJ399_13175 [Verrucomicrobia bacterium]|nr:hypothetical protein [Verrucomicrobiota bacterium]